MFSSTTAVSFASVQHYGQVTKLYLSGILSSLAVLEHVVDTVSGMVAGSIWILKILESPGNIFILLPFSRTGKSWKIKLNAGPGRSWKSTNSCKNNWSAVLFLDFYFVRLFCFNY